MKTPFLGGAVIAFALATPGNVQAQAVSAPSSRPPTVAPMDDVARIYDSLSARPGWPAKASEAEVDAGLARRGVKPEQRRAIIAVMRQDVCRLSEMVSVCRYYGAETIYKLQKLGWGNTTGAASAAVAAASRSEGGLLALQARLLEYGATQNLARFYGRKGTTDAQEAVLNNANRRAAKRLGFSTQLNVWFACRDDVRSLPATSLLPITRDYKLTTCGTGFGFVMAFSLFGWELRLETDLLLSHSRFARKVLLVWWPTGAEPYICADSVINGSGNQQCNNYSWSSPVSFKFDIFVNSTPSVVSVGTARRLNQPFSVSVVHQ